MAESSGHPPPTPQPAFPALRADRLPTTAWPTSLSGTRFGSREPLNYSLSFKRECLARSDSDQCLDFHWLLEPSGYLVPVVGRR